MFMKIYINMCIDIYVHIHVYMDMCKILHIKICNLSKLANLYI